MNRGVGTPPSWFTYHGWKLSLAFIAAGTIAGQLFLLESWNRVLQAAIVGYLLLLFYRIKHCEDKAYLKLSARSKFVTKECVQCGKMKPQRFYHCRSCNQCRFRMDHHCEWLGTCIFAPNIKLYVQILLIALVFASWTLLELMKCIPSVIRRESSLLTTVCGGVLSILAVISVFQLYRLLSEQYEAIKTNQTLVEGYKRVRGRKLRFMTNFKALFGNNLLEWLSPITSVHLNILEPAFPEGEPELLEREQQICKIMEDPLHLQHQSLALYDL